LASNPVIEKAEFCQELLTAPFLKGRTPMKDLARSFTQRAVDTSGHTRSTNQISIEHYSFIDGNGSEVAQ
jgi:hypothetical protein